MKLHEYHSARYKAEKTGSRFLRAAIGSIRDVILGAEDGFVSSVGVLTGIAVGTGDRFVVILSGFVVAIVEALSMSAGSYLSSKSEGEIIEKKLKEEMQEIEENPEKEAVEFREMFQERGFEDHEIDILLKRAQKDNKFMLEIMAYMELGVLPKHQKEPSKDAFFMFIFNLIGGIIPLIPYFFFSIEKAVFYSIGVTVFGLFALGAFKGLVVEKKWWVSGAEMALISISAAAAGFVIGKLVSMYFGVNPIV